MKISIRTLLLSVMITAGYITTGCVCNSTTRTVYGDSGGCSDSGYCTPGVPTPIYRETTTVCEGWFSTTTSTIREEIK